MPEPRPSDRRLSKAAITIGILIVLIVAAIFIAYNIYYIKEAQ